MQTISICKQFVSARANKSFINGSVGPSTDSIQHQHLNRVRNSTQYSKYWVFNTFNHIDTFYLNPELQLLFLFIDYLPQLCTTGFSGIKVTLVDDLFRINADLLCTISNIQERLQHIPIEGDPFHEPRRSAFLSLHTHKQEQGRKLMLPLYSAFHPCQNPDFNFFSNLSAILEK